LDHPTVPALLTSSGPLVENREAYRLDSSPEKSGPKNIFLARVIHPDKKKSLGKK